MNERSERKEEAKGTRSFLFKDIFLNLKNHRFSVSLLVIKLLDLRLVFIIVARITALNCELAVQKNLLNIV